MIWVGLTGGIGCGKSSALKAFKSLGCGIESADRIVSELYKDPEVLTEISKELRLKLEGLTLEEQKKSIANLVFKKPELLKKLESTLHPKVRKASEQSKALLEKAGFKVSFYEVPLLFEKKLESSFDKTLCIGTEKDLQISRIKERNPNWSEQEIELRIKAQMSLEEKKKKADFYIDNSKSFKELNMQCENLVTQLTKL